MKKDLLLFAGLGLIGYALYRFLQPNGQRLGSNFLSGGTATVPSSLGLAKPGTAPVFNPGYSTGTATRSPAGGGSSFDLGAVITAGTEAGRLLWDSVQGIFNRNRNPGAPYPQDFNTAVGESINNLNFDSGPLSIGYDSIDTGDYAGQV